MFKTTNKIVTNSRGAALPLLVVGSLMLSGAVWLGRGEVHAAVDPIDDGSVAALASLDQAMETVTSRVTPTIVNVAVVSRSEDHEAASAEGNGDHEEGAESLPPGFAQFFGQRGGQDGNQGKMQGEERLRGQPHGGQLERGVGSGVIVSPDGYIVTNKHVVNGAINIRVTLNDRRILSAKVVGSDRLTDLAVIKVAASHLPSIAWGDSTKLHPGQTVLAFGSPFGSLQFSVTRGIVSALNRPNPFATDARTPGAYIQTDAAINPGNSGGALVNAHGELVGINVGIITSTGSFAGAGFAIPSQTVHWTTDQLIAHGKVDRGFIGISMNDVTPANAPFFKLEHAEGAIVAQVSPESPASRAGVKQGDVIVQLNRQSVPDGGALQVAVSQMAPGSKLKLGILRNGQPSTLDLTVGSFQPDDQALENTGDEDAASGTGQARAGRFGLGLSDLSQELRQRIQVSKELHGTVVQTVRPGSPAEDAGLLPGDIILEVDRQPVRSSKEFIAQVHSAAIDKDILLLVWSKGSSSYRTLRLSEESLQQGQ